MNISKALKIKNRLVGEVNRLQELIRRENSRRNDNLSKIDPKSVFEELTQTRQKLINLRGAINEASSPLSTKLVELTENKAFLNSVKSIPTREGEEVTFVGTNREKLVYTWTAYLNQEAIDKIVVDYQNKINNLQDEIDLFNASTSVNYSE